jgi:hypothetical protein
MKGKSSNSARTSIAIENGHLNPPASKPTNSTHRDQQQFGTTLNVPTSKTSLSVSSTAPAATINPIRPAIMTTPKSSANMVKTSTVTAASRPVLMVTKTSNQQAPKTKLVAHDRLLPLNGRMATITPSKQRQQPTILPNSSNNHHQMINEMPGKKSICSRSRPALFYTSTRMYYEFS